MKVLKNIIVPIICFSIAALVISCESPFMDVNGKSAEGRVLVRLAGTDARTIMPSVPVFSRYELTFQKGDVIKEVNADSITSSGVTVLLYVGTWDITLNAYQIINGKEYIAAKGISTLTVSSNQSSYTIEMELNPIAIKGAVAAGVFSYNFILPNADTAILELKNNDSVVIKEIDLRVTNNGTAEVDPGYYDMNVILTRGGQYAGLFESVHIYSGLESKAVFDISNVTFAEKVYLGGNLGGIRIGTVKISGDAAGFDVIKEIDLFSDAAKRSDFWFIDIPAVNIGRTLYATLEFNGEKITTEISKLDANGKSDIGLTLIPSSIKYVNFAPWYSERNTDSTDLNFGFNLDVNFIKVIFDDDSASYKFGSVTASHFNAKNYTDSSLPIVGFEIYNAADRSAIIEAINSAQDNHDNTISSSEDGNDVKYSLKWVSVRVKSEYQTRIDYAKNAINDPMSDDAEIFSAKMALNEATEIFNNAKKWGRDAQIDAEDFVVVSGYANKYVVQLKNTHPLFKYQIFMSDASDVIGDMIDEKANTEGDINIEVPAAPDITKYFSIKVFFTEDNNRQIADIKIGPCKTLGIPVVWLAPGYSYSTLTAVWAPAQMADAYRVIYNYEGKDWEDAVFQIAADDLERDADGNFKYTFKPKGYNEIANSGKTLYVRILSINTAVYDWLFSEEVSKRLVGHVAITNVTATKAMSTNSIDVTWNALEGANGYYVSSRPYDLTNTNTSSANTFAYVSGNSYTLTNNQSDDGVVQGHPYRFVVVPVMNASDFTYTGDTYTLQENGEAFTLGTVSSVENAQTFGYAIGFAANVTASKGTYASSGNINDRIEIKWEKPYLLRDAGLQYRVYRKAYNSNTWEDLGTTGSMSLVDSITTRGVMYEYVVGLIHHVSGSDIRGPSRPDQSSIFIASERTKTDSRNRAKFQGFIQNTVTMNNVTRGEDAEANAAFGERVTWNGSGVAYGGSDVNWGVDGYTVYVMNRNINANWHVAADNLPPANSVLLTPNNTPSYNNTVNVARNVLYVMVDFKHFFKARSYSVREDGIKIYSPDPDWTYTYRHSTNQATHIANSNAMQNDYVKWGARQITSEEFIRICTLFMARGLDKANGTAWNTGYNGFPTYAAKTGNASTGMSGSGSVRTESNFGVTDWDIDYRSYKDDLQARCGQWVTFITINGKTRAHTGATNQYPQRYRAWDDNTWLDITGPWDTPLLYTGKIKVGTGSKEASTNLNWGSGNVSIQYNGVSQNISWRGEDTPLPYTGRGDNRHTNNTWR